MIFSITWLGILPFSLFYIYKYYQARKNEDHAAIKLYQPLTTILSLLICFLSFLSPYSNPVFTTWIIIAMSIALIGDVLNIDMTDMKVVIRGLLIFFVAYFIYTILTFMLADFTLIMVIPIMLMMIILTVVCFLIWNNLPSYLEKIAMVLYGALLSLMVAAGMATFYSPTFSLLTSIILTLGFLFLYLGDIEFALSSYWKPLNFPYGPMLYSGGQLLVAISLFFCSL
ncbi:MAG: lysoplasmalogenase family protein [Promethearchaeota archaeon]